MSFSRLTFWIFVELIALTIVGWITFVVATKMMPVNPPLTLGELIRCVL